VFTQALLGHTGPVVSLVHFGCDKLASGSEDCTLRIWDLATGACSMVIAAHTSPVCDVAVLNSSTIVSCAHDDPFVRAWNVGTGAPAWMLKHNDPIRLAATGGNRLAVSDAYVPGQIVVWH
jgi:WD40 repeat protein